MVTNVEHNERGLAFGLDRNVGLDILEPEVRMG